MSAWGFAKLEKKLKIWTHAFTLPKKRMTKKKRKGGRLRSIRETTHNTYEKKQERNKRVKGEKE